MCGKSIGWRQIGGLRFFLAAAIGGAAVPAAGSELQPLPQAAERILLKPGAAVRHRLMPENASLPPEGIKFMLRCEVSGRDGRVSCDVPAGTAELAQIARERASYHIFRVDDLLPDRGRPGRSDTDYEVELVEWIRPTDRRTIDTAGERIASSDVRFRTELQPGTLAGLYPYPALRAAAGARIGLTCRIQESLELFCVHPRLETDWPKMPPGIREHFMNAALAVSDAMRVEPQLGDGQAAAGKVFEWSIGFAVP